MIYSRDIERKCGLCVYAKSREGKLYCTRKKQAKPVPDDGCDKFSYDILKRHVRRRNKLKTNFNPEDFKLD